jgi:hypothetical protein
MRLEMNETQLLVYADELLREKLKIVHTPTEALYTQRCTLTDV